MSEIPDDIMAAAKAAYEAMPLCYDGWDEDAVILCIARAIMAERRRCADIAASNDHFPQEGEWIAAAILSTEEQKP